MYLMSVVKSKLIGKKVLQLLLLPSLLLFLLPGLTKAENTEKNVLVLHSYDAKFPWTSNLARGINKHLQEGNSQVKTFHEFLDAKRYPEMNHDQTFLSYIQDKYKDTKIDALMVSDDPGLQLVLKVRDRYFADIPIVFLGINHIQEELLNLPGVTGVFENRDVAETIWIAKEQTGSEELIIINDSSETGIANLQKIKKIQQDPRSPKQITIIDDLTPQNISQKFRTLNPQTPILLLGQSRDNTPAKALQSFETTIKLLQSHVTNPVYAVTLDVLNSGIIGGKFLEPKLHAEQAAELTKQILQGASVDQIAPITKAENKWLFDIKKLKQHNIALESIPDNSELINSEKSFFEKYQKLVWLVTGSFSLSLLVIALLIEIIRKNAINEKILKENELRYRDLAKAGANIFWELDQNFQICYISGDTENIWGISKHEMLGKSLQQLFCDNNHIEFPWEAYETVFKARQPMDMIFKIVKNNPQNNHISINEVGIFQLNGKPIYDEENKFIGYRGIQREVTTEFNLSQKIAYQATYDSLTGSINRREFNDRLKSLVEETKISNQNSVLCFLDLDRFKPVNDTAGHLIGDTLLAELAQLFQSCIREQDTLGRLGGDEFGLLLKGISLFEAKLICQEIINKVKKYQFFWRDRYFTVGVSIGMIEIQSNIDATELLSKADLACYKAKDLGRGRVYIADDQALDLEQDREKMEYVANISQAIENGYFYLVKQPIKAIESNNSQYHHYEILLRYKDPLGKNISPGVFIPAAEKYGVITLIDRWVLEQIIDNYNHYFPCGKTTVSINLSGVSLSNEDFIQQAIAIVQKSHINPQNICFEITETAAISQLSKATEFITTMKKLGVKFALDDFGSGASSFGYLKNLPVDYLKIDGSLIKSIVNEPSDRAIVDAVNCIAQMMGMKTIAEFVENPEILAILTEIGIDYAQGYGIGKPVICNSLETATK